MKPKGIKLFLVVASLYLSLFFLFPQKALLALEKSGSVLAKIGPILILVVLLSAFINLLIKPERFAKYFGKESGMQGWVIALAAGIISHGPMYAWYPMIEDLKKHGLKNSFITVFFYARAVKVPLLPIMIDYFGIGFTSILTLYTLLAALLQGFIIEKLGV